MQLIIISSTTDIQCDIAIIFKQTNFSYFLQQNKSKTIKHWTPKK